MDLIEWCKNKGEVEYSDDDWKCSFKNGTEIRKENSEFVVKVLPKSHYDSSEHIKDVFRSKYPKVESEDTLMFGAEEVKLYKDVLISVPRKET